MKAITECPVCHSKKLKQEFKSTTRVSDVIGGPHVSSPSMLDGCYCEKCGTVFKTDVAGRCPTCDGTGQMKSVHYGGSWDHTGITHARECWSCQGSGKIK